MPVKNQIPTSPSMKQGIVTILSSDCEKNYKSSIRRTLSADMSSKKWFQQNGFFGPLKNIASPSSSSSSSTCGEEDSSYQTPGHRDDVWTSIQANKEKTMSWDSIFSQKRTENCLFPPPYVHPLVKRSVSGLSEKSLEICTENLGSETGSDCFSYSANCSSECPNEVDGVCKEIIDEEANKTNSDPFEHLQVIKYKSSPAKPLPPPLPSIAAGGHMQSRRENGRLILEAVSVSSKNNFHAQRREGRLVLTLVHDGKTVTKSEEVEEVFNSMEDVPAEEMVDEGGGDAAYEEGEEEEFVAGKNLSLPNGMLHVHKSGLPMKKTVAMGNMNANWPNKVEGEEIPVPQSLPPPSMARLIPEATSFNAYKYFWRNKTTTVGFVNPMINVSEAVKNKNPNNNNSNNNKPYENQNLVITKANKGERFVPYSRGCKEPRRSLSFWDSYCIATT